MLTLKYTLPEDEAFLYRLYVSTKIDEFSILGIPEKEIEPLLCMQYEAQKASYRGCFPSAHHQIVVHEQVPIGRIITNISDQEVLLVDISLLPEFRGQGFGTMLLREVQRMATEEDLPVKLHVLIGNPAQRLYARLGFCVIGEPLPFIYMQWNPLAS